MTCREIEGHDDCLLFADQHHIILGELLHICKFMLKDGGFGEKGQSTPFMIVQWANERFNRDKGFEANIF